MYYKTWREAREAALAQMRQYQHAYGIEYNKYMKAYSVKMIANDPTKRYGWEMRCEAVELGSAL